MSKAQGFLASDLNQGSPFRSPVERTNRTRMQIPIYPFDIITFQSMLIPSMINWLNVPSQHEQK